MASASVAKVLILIVFVHEVSSQQTLLDMILGNTPSPNKNAASARRRPPPMMMDPLMMALGGMGFEGFGGMSAMGGMNNMFGGPPAQPNPFAQLSTAEEQMAETLTETGKTNPDRMRMERVINQVGGKFTGELAALNYIVQDFWMTTPGPVPPPNRQAAKKGPGVTPARTKAGRVGGTKRQGMGPNGPSGFQQMGPPRGQAMANAGPQMLVGQAAPGRPAASGVMGMPPAGSSRRQTGPPMAGRQGPPYPAAAKAIGMPPAVGSSRRQTGPPMTGQQGPPYPQRQGLKPVGRPAGPTPGIALQTGPPARKPVGMAGPPMAGPPVPPKRKGAPARKAASTGNPTRQQIIREKIQALRTKLNQLKTQTVNGKNPQMLGVQNQINGLVKLQKQVEPKPKRARAPRRGKIEVITRPPTLLRQGTIPARHRIGVPKMNGQPTPTTAGYDMFGLVNPAFQTMAPAKPAGAVGTGAPSHLATMPPNGQPAPGGEPTQAPQFGDVRYMNGHKYMFTDADGFDLGQWIKQAPGQANNQNQAHEGQNGQNGPEAGGQGQGGANGNV